MCMMRLNRHIVTSLHTAFTLDREREQHTVPGMVRDKSDWSENGECKVKHQMRSEYWTIVYYSLLISITSYLVTSVWKDREDPLQKGYRITLPQRHRRKNERQAKTTIEHLRLAPLIRAAAGIVARPEIPEN